MTPDQFRKAMHGVTAIAVTPMKDGGEIDHDGIRTHLRFLVNNGVKAPEAVLVITGSTGESGALTPDERFAIWETSKDEVGEELPLVAGVNHSDVGEVVRMTTKAGEMGLAGVMAVSPYYYTPTDDVAIEFYKRLSDASDLGIMLYNNLEVTHYDIPVSVLEQIASSASNVVGIKECTPNVVKMERVARELGDDIAVINGHGEFLEPYAALMGTAGFISSTSNFAPAIAMDVWRKRSSGDFTGAADLRRQLTPYLDYAGELGAAGGEPRVLQLLKQNASFVSGIDTAARLPLLPLSPDEITKAQAVVEALGLDVLK